MFSRNITFRRFSGAITSNIIENGALILLIEIELEWISRSSQGQGFLAVSICSLGINGCRFLMIPSDPSTALASSATTLTLSPSLSSRSIGSYTFMLLGITLPEPVAQQISSHQDTNTRNSLSHSKYFANPSKSRQCVTNDFPQGGNISTKTTTAGSKSCSQELLNFLALFPFRSPALFSGFPESRESSLMIFSFDMKDSELETKGIRFNRRELGNEAVST